MRFLLLTALFASLLTAADKPNYSGEWKLNPAKSDFGQMPSMPSSFVRKIDHKDPEMKVSTSMTMQQGAITTDAKYTTDGKESVNNVRGADVKSVMGWKGNDISLVSKRPLPDGSGEITSTESWTLSEGGKTMTVVSEMAAPQGKMTFRLVMEKQEQK